MSDIQDNLAEIRSRIESACQRAGRPPSSVELVAVSKTFPAESIREAFDAGQLHFGESKLQEAESKIDLLPSSVHWHFIGRIQRNKLRRILSRFEIIHAVDSTRLALQADDIACELGIFPKVFLQVNVGGEETKGGFELEALRAEMEGLLSMKRLDVIGLMCIPPAGPDAESSRGWFAMLRELRDQLEQESGVKLPSLSMGMSGDFEVAIEEGATHVRVGSSIFGKRTYRVDVEAV
jgi:pyridoxal phosphate enzyme (YggS family)